MYGFLNKAADICHSDSYNGVPTAESLSPQNGGSVELLLGTAFAMEHSTEFRLLVFYTL